MIFTNNKILKKFLPYNEKTIQYLVNKKQNANNTELPSSIDIYFYNTYIRVMEIDDIFKKLKISLEYIGKIEFSESNFNFITHHSFHIENFLLRLTGLIDRCYLYSGTSLNLDSKKIEKLGRKKLIIKKLDELSHKNSDVLKELDNLVNNFYEERNKIVHQSNYSRETFIILEALDNEDKNFSQKFNNSCIDINEIKCYEISISKELFSTLLDDLEHIINKLIINFDDLYVNIIENSKKSK